MATVKGVKTVFTLYPNVALKMDAGTYRIQDGTVTISRQNGRRTVITIKHDNGEISRLWSDHGTPRFEGNWDIK